MGKNDEVFLLCDGDSVDNSQYWGYKLEQETNKEFFKAIVVFVLFSFALLIIVLLHPNLGTSLKSALGSSERYTADIEDEVTPEPTKEPTPIPVIQSFSSSEASVKQEEESTTEEEEPVTLNVKVDGEDPEDSLENEDEIEGLRGHIGSDMPHEDAVGFILPLRDHVGNQGVRFAKKLKGILEDARVAYEESAAVKEVEKRSVIDNTLPFKREMPPITSWNDSKLLPPSHVLIRDSRGDFEISRQLTQHFYEEHGMTRFFGFLTDEEAMASALWARVRAPGARFVTPTAISTYLDSAANVRRVQPSAKVLATALADFLVTLDLTRPLIVARASMHTDVFVSLLRPLGIKPSQVIHYYETTRFRDLAEKIRERVLVLQQPVLLLGDAESWEIIHLSDSFFSCLWICPFPTQLHDHIRTTRSELIYFMYRAFDDAPETPMKDNPSLDPNESIVQASLDLVNGERRSWRGSYVVVASVSQKSLMPRTKILGVSSFIPILQYDLTRKGISRRVYHELQLTDQLLRPLTAGSQCNVVVRYIEELTGNLKQMEVPIDFLQSTLLVPAGRGAQLHLDCPRHHVDLRCAPPKASWSPIKCRGTIQGIHHYQSYCEHDVGVTFSATRGCTLSKALQCVDGQTLGCRLATLCSSVSHSRFMYNCDGIPIARL